MVDSWKGEEGEEEGEEQGGGGRGGGKGEMVIYCFVCLHAAGVVSGDTKSCGFWTAILQLRESKKNGQFLQRNWRSGMV